MKLWKMCWYDIKNGCLKNIKLLLFPIVYEIVVLFAMMQKVVSYEKWKNIWEIYCYTISEVCLNMFCLQKRFLSFR